MTTRRQEATREKLSACAPGSLSVLWDGGSGYEDSLLSETREKPYTASNALNGLT